jgi:predicted lipoprotein
MKILQVLLLSIFLNLSILADDKMENTQVLKNLYDNVILSSVDGTLLQLKNIEEALKAKDTKKVQNSFEYLVKNWKSVEAFYILGDLNDEYIDTPRYIDIFHNGNEDITQQLDRAIKSTDEIRVVLFKNSLKSINALEYVLFAKDINDSRVNSIALKIVATIKSLVEDIKEEYKNLETNFLSDVKKANSITINTIVQNTYKLKEWRIGEVLGLTKKYEGDPDNKRAEYYLSKNSANGIEAILTTLKNIFDNDKYEDYGDFLLKITNEKQVKRLRDAIDKSILLTKKIKNDDFSNSKELYEEVSEIHVILFLEIIEELSINAKILEADGD